MLDRLRAARKLPEQPDFRVWKAKLHEAYRALEPENYTWFLPDGRAVSVVTTPNLEGGVTYLFDNVTESLDLARRYDRLTRVQHETLDNLAEAVAVFGSNGRVELFNPAFEKMWKLSAESLKEQPHIETVEAWCKPLFDDALTWRALREAITAIENRAQVSLKLERKDGSVLDCMTMPLPDGATMLTFQDITDTENVERALRERNEALEAADQMEVYFVHHVSYELRAPLTTIIGFAHFLSDPSTGPLTPKQAEYLDYVTKSTNALLALTNNILDLATIDAGAMKLELGPVNIDQPSRPPPKASRTGLPPTASNSRSISTPISAASSATSGAWCRCSIISSPTLSDFHRRIPRSPSARGGPTIAPPRLSPIPGPEFPPT